MPTTPPTLTPAPTPAPQRNERTTFAPRVDAFVTWLIAFVAQMVALAANCYDNSLEAFNSAIAAEADANTATTQAGIATTQAAAALAAAQSAISAASSGTSTTAITLGAGTHTLTVASGKSWVPGMLLRVYYGAGYYMDGVAYSYIGTTLVLTVPASLVVGSGAYANWSIFPAPAISSVDGQMGAVSSLNNPIFHYLTNQ